ncbi:restriction endonuclease subunit S [Candidatus Poriferisodalis sp.]|uniref:restriction endonuclease subunit S n=1 Tax=Candidatus Poriferisodalis sp. TaxID=3101277 RepID=UPI003B024AB5
MSWSTKTLGEIADECGGEVRTGPFGSQLHKCDYVDDLGATPVVMPKDMADGKIDISSIARIDEPTVERLNSHILCEEDIVLGRRGDIGRRAWVGADEAGWLCGTGSMRISVGNGRDLLPRFLYYYLESPLAIEWLKGHSVGATMSNLSAGVVRQLPVTFPSISTQMEIIDALDSFEALVENNRRRIETLDEMARLLYQEWFVHLRFPSHEAVELVDSNLGPIPGDWSVATLGDVCSLVMGQSPRSEYYNDTGEGLPFHQGVSNFGKYFPTHVKWTTVDKRVAEPGDILFSVRAPVGRINLASDRLVVGRGLCAIRALDGNQGFLLQQLKDTFVTEDMIGGGTIFNSVTKKDMESITLLIPSERVARDFESAVLPMAELIKHLTQVNTVARDTRDLLLPRLVSGELDVLGPDSESEAMVA